MINYVCDTVTLDFANSISRYNFTFSLFSLTYHQVVSLSIDVAIYEHFFDIIYISMRVVFMGSSDASATCLKAIMRERELEVVGVVTQPDRPAGRGKTLTPCPCKAFAIEHGITEIITPEDVNTEDSMAKIRSWKPDSLKIRMLHSHVYLMLQVIGLMLLLHQVLRTARRQVILNINNL